MNNLNPSDKFPSRLLPGSSGYHASNNSLSSLCRNPMASIKVERNQVEGNSSDREGIQKSIGASVKIPKETQEFSHQFKTDERDLSILVIDNYDSFVYNLVHYLEDLGCEVTVKRNNEIRLKEVDQYNKILLSPGPGIPSEAGMLNEIVKTYAPTKSILGVCLGQQAIGEVFGAKLHNLNTVFHGVATAITVNDAEQSLFNGLPRKLEVGRYHSWVVNELPAVLIPTSYDETGQVMSLRHRDFDVCAVQFHPESVLTPKGKQILRNWVKKSPSPVRSSKR